MVIALALLAMVLTPAVALILATTRASSGIHLRAEATDLATQALETAQYQAASGLTPSSGSTTFTRYSGSDPFQVKLTYALTSQSGGSDSICVAPPGQTSSEIWSVTAAVTWRGDTSAGPVIQTTLISPATSDQASLAAGEIAVPVYAAGDADLETSQPIYVSVSGTCIGSACSSETVPSDEYTSGSANTGTSGCAVFPDLFAGVGWSYTVTVTGDPGWVDPTLLSSAATASGQVTRAGISVQPDAVTVVDNPNIILAQGADMSVKFQTENFVSAPGDQPTASSVLPAPYLPISVQSATLLCPGEVCVLGGGTASTGFSSASPQHALLFPGPSTSPNYIVWAGDRPDSNPQSASGWYGATGPTAVTADAGTSGSATVPVYPLTLKVTDRVTGETISSISASDAGGGDSFTLSPVTGGTSATGLPLGQFVLSAVATGTGSSSTVSIGGASPVYVWMTPTGICASSTVMTAPCTSPSTAALAVTAG